MGKGWNPKRRNKERFLRGDYKEKVRTNKIFDTSGETIAEAGRIIDSNPREAIRMLKPLVEKGINTAIKMILQAYYLLNDLASMEKIIKKLKSAGKDTTLFELELVTLYLRNNNLARVGAIYAKAKGKVTFDVYHKIEFAKYFIEIGDFKSARELYFQIPLNKTNVLYTLLKRYLDASLSKPEHFSEAMAFILELHERGRLTGENLKNVFNALYSAKQYLLMTRIYSLLKESDRTIFITFDYLNALRKLKKYPIVIGYIDSLLRIYTKEKDKLAWGELSAIKAFCLLGQNKVKDAQRILKEVIDASSPSDFYFDWALCGYIYTNPQLTPVERAARITYLQGRHSVVSTPNLKNDIADALAQLSRTTTS